MVQIVRCYAYSASDRVFLLGSISVKLVPRLQIDQVNSALSSRRLCSPVWRLR